MQMREDLQTVRYKCNFSIFNII